MKRFLVLALGTTLALTAFETASAGLFDIFRSKNRNGCCAPDPCCRPARKRCGLFSFLHHDRNDDACCVPAAPAAPCCDAAPVSCCAPQPTCCNVTPACCNSAGGAYTPSVAPMKPYEETPPPPKKGSAPPPKPGKKPAT